MRLTSAAQSDFLVTIHEGDLDSLAGFVAEYPHCETGGNLFGFWTHSGAPAIQLILGPGPQARHESAAFYQDAEFMANEGSAVQHSFGLQHIGDWHSHHTLGLSEPSGGDSQTIRRTLRTYRFPRFMAVIATLQPPSGLTRIRSLSQGRNAAGGIVEINAFLFERDSNIMRRGSWVVLPGTSPITDAARGQRVADIGVRPTAQWQVELAPVAASAAPAPPAGWYTQRWGTDFLRTFDAQCRQVFDNCRIASGPNPGDLYYTFDREGIAGTIAFPPEFPQDIPVMIFGDREVQLDALQPHLSQPDLARVLVQTAMISISDRHTPPSAVGSTEEVSNGLDRRTTEET